MAKTAKKIVKSKTTSKTRKPASTGRKPKARTTASRSTSATRRSAAGATKAKVARPRRQKAVAPVAIKV